MNGTMLYKHKCVLPNTHQNLQVSCTEIYSGSFSKMKILFPKPSTNTVLIYRRFLQVKSGSLQRNRGIKSYRLSCKASYKWPWSSPNQSYETSQNRPPTKQNQVETTIIQVKIKSHKCIQVSTNNKCHPIRRNLILIKHIQEKIDVTSMEIQSM